MTLLPYDDVASSTGLQNMPSQLDGIPIIKTIMAYSSPATLKGAGKLFGILMIGWMFLPFFGFVFGADSDGFPVGMFCWFFLGPVVIGAGIVGGFALLMSTLLSPPELLITEVVLKRDATFDIRYKQIFKRGVILKSRGFTLILRESATYQQGTNTVTEHHDNVIDERIEFDIPVAPDSPIDEHLTFNIPADAMHTFEAERNKLNWFLRVSLDIPNFPDYRRDYKLRVLPEVNHEI